MEKSLRMSSFFSKFSARSLQLNLRWAPQKAFFQGFSLSFKQFAINLYFFKGTYLAEHIPMAAFNFCVLNSKSFSSPW